VPDGLFDAFLWIFTLEESDYYLQLGWIHVGSLTSHGKGRYGLPASITEG
jgi:hypothetical protein